MSKEELRKEFKEIPYDPSLVKYFDWFYSKLEEKDQEIANHKATNSLLLDSDSEADLANKIFQLEAKLKAADEVIKNLSEYVNSISGRDITADTLAHQNYLKALDHYKSLTK